MRDINKITNNKTLMLGDLGGQKNPLSRGSNPIKTYSFKAVKERIYGHRTITTGNHKTLGLYYLSSALLFGVSGTLWSMILRLELYSSGHRIIPPENQNFYNLAFTLHGLFMIFLFIKVKLFRKQPSGWHNFMNLFIFLEEFPKAGGRWGVSPQGWRL